MNTSFSGDIEEQPADGHLFNTAQVTAKLVFKNNTPLPEDNPTANNYSGQK